jgi:hypothetical protein
MLSRGVRCSILATAVTDGIPDLARKLRRAGHEVALDLVVMAGVTIPEHAELGILVKVWPCLAPTTFNPIAHRSIVMGTTRRAAYAALAERSPDLVLAWPGVAFVGVELPHPRVVAIVRPQDRERVPARWPKGWRTATSGAIATLDLDEVTRWVRDGAAAVAEWRTAIAKRPLQTPGGTEALAFQLDETPQD